MKVNLFVTILIVLIILATLSSLGMALYYLVKDQGKGKQTAKALFIRIILSFLLFIALFIAFAMGWIIPNTL